jgi:DNA-binding winged helix-turn-helix (wHTH) protein/Tol biopolymer transport system component
MDDSNSSARVVRFGVFEADLQTGELHKNGARVPLQGQPFQVCAILLSHSGELVSREELREKVWPEDTFVDFDQALNTAIAKIRIALGDDADNPRFVETLPRRGYRFISPVDKPMPQVPLAPERRLEKFTAKTRWMSVGATVFAVLCGVGIWRFSRSPNVVPLPPIEVLPLAGLSGFEIQPAFSPDGNHVAFVLHAANYSGIHTAMIGGQKSLRLTSNSGDCCPKWSPDGREIAFSRPSDSGVDIYVIPALGGTEHRVFSWPPEGHQVSTLPPWRVNGRSLDWSPNGKVLAFSDTQPDKTHAWIALLSVADSTIRPLTSPSSQTLDYGPAFSPDGSPIQVTTNGGVFAAESADGRFLYYAKYETPGIWKMPLKGGEEIRILDQPAGESWWNWALAPNGIYFFGPNGGTKSGVNFLDFASGKKATLLAAVDRPSVGLAVSPDGRSILYVQNDQEGGQYGRYEWANSRIMLVKNFR